MGYVAWGSRALELSGLRVVRRASLAGHLVTEGLEPLAFAGSASAKQATSASETASHTAWALGGISFLEF